MLLICKFILHDSKPARYTERVSKRYDQYCPVAHALGLVGERWSLLIVRELLHGPKRYTDLSASLPGIGSNILAARLKELETAGIVTKRRLEPPFASQVYELTEYGLGLKPVMRELALWGLRTIGPPSDDDEFAPGWLYGAVDTVFAPVAPPGSIEDPDVLVEADRVEAFYWMFVERRLDGVAIEGDRELLERLLDAASPAPDAPVAA